MTATTSLKNKTGATYLRVSTEDQTAANQRADIDRWLAARGLAVRPDLWHVDEGWSRSDDTTRPAFNRLLALVRQRKVDYVVVFALDRFAASTALGVLSYLGELERAGVALYSATEDSLGNLASSNIATAIMGLLKASQSVEELERKSARSLSGHKQYAGNVWGDVPPYGYDRACVGPDGRVRWRLVWDGYERDARGALVPERGPDGRPRTTKKGGHVHRPVRTRVWPDGRTEVYVGYEHAPQPDKGDRWVLVPSARRDRVEAVRLL